MNPFGRAVAIWFGGATQQILLKDAAGVPHQKRLVGTYPDRISRSRPRL